MGSADFLAMLGGVGCLFDCSDAVLDGPIFRSTLRRSFATTDCMKPSDYAEAVDGSRAAFARRAGIPQTTFNAICQGNGCNARTALIVIRASHDRPAPGGGVISLEDIVLLSAEQAA